MRIKYCIFCVCVMLPVASLLFASDTTTKAQATHKKKLTETIDRYPLLDDAQNVDEQDHYRRFLQEGERLLKKGEYELAGQAYLRSLDFPLHEAPNFEGIVGIAEAKCRLGKKDEGLNLTDDFDCMLNVLTSRVSCYPGLNEDSPDFSVSVLCYLRMCGEAIVGAYETARPEILSLAEKLRLRNKLVKEICAE